MIERTGLLNFYGNDVTVVGPDLQVGQVAPEFIVRNTSWNLVNALESTRGLVRIIGSLPSLNTSVCDRETRRFNQEAAALSDQIAVLMVSMDLPWSQRQWCAAAGIDRVQVLSDHKDADFGQKYGVLVKEPRILRRAIFVVDAEDRLVYVAYMSSLGDEPDYAAVLEVAQSVLATSPDKLAA